MAYGIGTHNDPELLPSFMGELMVRFFHMSWTSQCRLKSKILLMLTGELTLALMRDYHSEDMVDMEGVSYGE